MAGELYLVLAVVSVTVFGVGLAYYSAQQGKLDRARPMAQQRQAAPERQAERAHA
jgi:hypothetical protein